MFNSFYEFSSEVKRMVKILADYDPIKPVSLLDIPKGESKAGRLKGLSKTKQLLANYAEFLYTTNHELSTAEIRAETRIKSKATLYRYLRFMNVEIQPNESIRANLKFDNTYLGFTPIKSKIIFCSIEILKEYKNQVINLMKVDPDIFELISNLVVRASLKKS